MDNQTIILLCASGAVALIGFIVAQLLLNRGDGEKLRSRLKGGGIDTRRAQKQAPRMKDFVQQIGQRAAQPFMTDDANKQVVIRRGLARAGIYSPSAIRMVAGSKVICLGAGLLLGWAAGMYFDQFMFGISLGGLGGYLAPVIWLKFRTAKNQRLLTNGLPDTLDLMVVCIESGLTIDAAMQRVGQELVMAHPAISREFGLSHMETRVGLTRTEALKNMGQRTGNKALQSLGSMLIQAERFGTSIADALRVHSESLRINRQMAAEEAAGKASVKMSFPLVLCIFPATFIVLAGPTIIQLVQSSLFN
jgi:tight adherence protein C